MHKNNIKKIYIIELLKNVQRLVFKEKVTENLKVYIFRNIIRRKEPYLILQNKNYILESK